MDKNGSVCNDSVKIMFTKKMDKNGDWYYLAFSNTPGLLDLSDTVWHFFQVKGEPDLLELVIHKYDKDKSKGNRQEYREESQYDARKRERSIRRFNDE